MKCDEWDQCPAGSILKDGASGIEGAREDICCETVGFCDAFTCPNGTVPNSANPSNVTGNSESSCCEAAPGTRYTITSILMNVMMVHVQNWRQGVVGLEVPRAPPVAQVKLAVVLCAHVQVVPP